MGERDGVQRFKACGVQECERLVGDKGARGYCPPHYHRLMKYGDPTFVPARKPRRMHCDVEGCKRVFKARGLCELHYERLMRIGSVDLYEPSDEERFWEKVNKRGGDDCWEWQASRHPRGHGYFMWNGKVSYAHRYSLELYLGRPVKQQALHHCDNPPCVNPKHLYEGSPLLNVDDAISRGRVRNQFGKWERTISVSPRSQTGEEA